MHITGLYRLIIGGGTQESNLPGKFLIPLTRFEDEAAHQRPTYLQRYFYTNPAGGNNYNLNKPHFHHNPQRLGILRLRIANYRYLCIFTIFHREEQTWSYLHTSLQEDSQPVHVRG